MCVNSQPRGPPPPQVVDTVTAFLKNTSMAAMPLYAQGYSSGGTMLLKLPAFLESK